MKKLLIALGVVAALSFGGCAQVQNKISRDGGLFGSYNGDWIVVKYSGGKIMDVWKLNNTIVQSEEHSDGWLFQDDTGNAINIGGDVKVFRVNNVRDSAAILASYHEYHYDVQGGSYEPMKK